MITRYITSALPRGFRFWETDWYRATIRDYNRYRFIVLVIAHAIAILIPLSMLAFHLASGETALVWNYCVPVALLSASLAYLVVSKNINVLIPLILAGAIAGMVASCYLPGNMDVFIAIFLAYPLLAFHLHGIGRGAMWICAMTVTAAAVIALDKSGFTASSISALTNTQLIMGLTSYGVIVIFTHAGEMQHRKYIATITREMVYDSVTSLPEKDAILYSMELKTSYLIAIIRIDNFSQFVSLFGYEFSDNILQFVVKNIRDIEKDFGFQTFRLRGFEFGILLPLRNEPPSKSELEAYLYRIWKKLSERNIPWDSTKIRLIYRMSGAIATVANKFHVLSNADRALKEGMRANRPVTIYSEDYDYEHESALSSVIRFTVLSENHEKKLFKAVYQPIVDTKSRSVVWYECLVRIRNTGGEYEPPVKYLQIARSTGMDTVIAQFMLETACAALERCDTDISINITLQDMQSERFLEQVEKALAKRVNGKGALIFEILERDDLADAQSCLKFINRVRELGCKIAIDDFGTGYSNFFNVLNLPVDIVKIDGSLVKRMIESSNARSMIEGIASLFNKMGIPLVAEYVENEEIFSVLNVLNINYMQGYHFGMPGENYF
ncbi:MAG: EAL domain-containing protein [Spirochaetes bacterium]|nr:EAL domain-containing protein [Spirochaetota bacterium]